MNTHTILTFAAVAGLSIATPGPAVILTLRNGASLGVRSVVWSAFGNICGVFCLSVAAILGLGVMLTSSALLFGIVKLIGAAYLFYIGLRHLFGRVTVLTEEQINSLPAIAPSRHLLYREAFLTAATNPKAVLFFTALFPQFLDAQAPLMPQFFILTGVFMTLSYLMHMSYAMLASRAGKVLRKPGFVKTMNRLVGAVFVTFGAMLLTIRRQT
jgi:threonine/homoserine/homoserine lactone efflux protein